MTSNRSDGTLGAMASGEQRAVKRMRLARRIADALLPQPDGVILEALSRTEVLSSAPEALDAPTADFILSLLDMKIRLVLLVGQASDSLYESASVDMATAVLRQHADTIACALVADDEVLSTRLVESGETSEVIASQAGARETLIGPLRPMIEEYFRLIDPSWPAAPSVLPHGQLDYEEVARQAGQDAMEERRRVPGRVTERQLAREKLSDADADWAVSVSMRIASGRDVNLVEILESTSGTTS